MAYQSLKSIHYRKLLIFQNKKNNKFEGQNMGGGDKRHVIPPCQKMGGIYTPIPPGFTPLGPRNTIAYLIFHVMG